MALPQNTGPFQVGCIDILTKANDIPKDFHPTTLSKLQLGSLVRLFYPCVKTVDVYAKTNTESSKQNDDVSTIRKMKWLAEPYSNLYIAARALYAQIYLPYTIRYAITNYFLQKPDIDAYSQLPLVNQDVLREQHVTECFKDKLELPVVIFCPGLNSSRFDYAVFCAQLASEGYLVAIVEYRDGSSVSTFILDETNVPVEIPYFKVENADSAETMDIRQTQLDIRVKEVSFVIDILSRLNSNPSAVENMLPTTFDMHSFKNRLDMETLVILGHSFGGATMLRALKEITQLKCGFGLDVWFEPLKETFYDFNETNEKPNFLITTQYFIWRKNLALYHKYNKCFNEKEMVEHVVLKEASHFDQMDIGGITSIHLTAPHNKPTDRRIIYSDAIKQQRTIISQYLHKFHRERGRRVKLLDGSTFQLTDYFTHISNIPMDIVDYSYTYLQQLDVEDRMNAVRAGPLRTYFSIF